MATSQSDLDYPYPVPADLLTAPEIVPGIRWLRFAVDGPLDHVNAYALADGDGWTVVDTGLGNAATRERWQAYLAGALGGRPLQRIVCTHGHPDHVGQAGWLQEVSGAPILMTAKELQLATNPRERTGLVDANLRPFYHRAGLAEAVVDTIVERSLARPFAPLTPAGSRVTIIADGEVLAIGERRWRVIVGAGHSPEHACLYDEAGGVLISGDQILPAISPNISVFPRLPDADPLADFLAALDHLRELPADVLVLPGHGLPFRGLHRRVAALQRHHGDHLDRLVAALATPEPCASLLPLLFRRALSGMHLIFGVGEALAHLNFLMAQGRILRLREGTGPDLYLRAG